jgi:hypothetical protein
VTIYIILLFIIYFKKKFKKGGGGRGYPYFFLHISTSWVKIRLHAENQLPRLPGSALKVYVGGGGVGWSN